MKNVNFLIKNKSKIKKTKFLDEVFLFIQYLTESIEFIEKGRTKKLN